MGAPSSVHMNKSSGATFLAVVNSMNSNNWESVVALLEVHWRPNISTSKRIVTPNVIVPPSRLASAIIAILLACCIIFPYIQACSFNSYVNGFHMDDVVAIMKNNDVVRPDSTDWYQFLRNDFWGLDMFCGEWTHKSFRPLTTMTYRLNFLMMGLDTSAYHISNVLLHDLSSLLVGQSAHSLFSLTPFTSALVACLFAVHPVHTESVLYLVGRADILCAVLILLAMMAYHRGAPAGKGTNLFTIISYALLLMAGLSKEIGFMIFFALVLFDLTRSRVTPRRVLVTTLVGVVAIIVRHWYTEGTSLKMSPQDNPISFESDPWGRRLSYALVHGEYFRLLVWPYFLCYDYSMDTIPLACDWVDVRLLLSLVGYLTCALLISFGVRLFRGRPETSKDENISKLGGHLLVVMGIFVLVFLPMSNVFFPVGTVVGERLLYIPSIALVWSLGLAIDALRPRRSFLFILIALWFARTAHRVNDWQTADYLTVADGTRNMKSAKTQFNLGVHYFTRQQYDESYAAFERSWQSDVEQRDAIPFWRAGQIELMRGNAAAAEKLLVGATTKYGAKLMVREEEIFHDAGLAAFHNGHVEDGVYYLSASIQLNPRLAKGYSNLACALESLGRVNEALNLAIQAANLRPRNAIYWGNVWILAAKADQLETSEQAKAHTLSIQESYIPNPSCTWEFKPAEGGPGDTGEDDEGKDEGYRRGVRGEDLLN